MMQKGNDDEKIGEELVDISQLPKAKGWYESGVSLYQGSWCRTSAVQNIIRFQKHFEAEDGDIVFASNPKSGTTWMKALLFSIVNRHRYSPSDTPLLSSNPHDLVPSFEMSLFSDPPAHHLAGLRSPRLFSTHVPFASLPAPLVSKSRILYICRNPLDTIVSFWHFVRGHPNFRGSNWTMDDCVEAFCRGESAAGPFWVHVLGFWRASLERPDKVLFLKYEDMLVDPASYVRRIAEFVGFPFSEEEENLGIVDQIVELCSFENLKKLDVNKNGKLAIRNEFGNNIFFRNGQVGDWANHLSPSMVQSVNKVIQEKLSGSGLTFKYN